MTESLPEPPPEPFFLRDRLYSTLTEFEAKEPYAAVEAVCTQVSAWLRAQADQWHEQAARDGDITGVAKAAAILAQGMADGIDKGAPKVTDQDSGVQSES